MISTHTTLTLALAAIALSCSGSSSSPAKPRPNPDGVDLSIASVTLADDCGTGPTEEPPAEEASMHSSQKPSAGAPMSMSQMQGDRACEQSSVQIRVANGSKEASAITITKIELLDESGTVLRELEAREPSRWADDAYQPWDQQVAPDQILQVSYALSAPQVSAGDTYTVRVTIAAGDGERTIEKRTKLEAEASLPPGAVT